MRSPAPAAAATALLILLASCVSGPKTAPTPQPTPVPPPSPLPAAPVPLSGDWTEWPVTPGDWSYRPAGDGSVAQYGTAGNEALIRLICVKASRQLRLSRRVAVPAAGSVTVRTTSATRALAVSPVAGGGYVGVMLAASDPVLDAIAFSRGRFVLDQAGQPPLVAPPWAEIGRVIEDCRG